MMISDRDLDSYDRRNNDQLRTDVDKLVRQINQLQRDTADHWDRVYDRLSDMDDTLASMIVEGSKIESSPPLKYK